MLSRPSCTNFVNYFSAVALEMNGGPLGQILDVLINEFQAFSDVRGGSGRGGLIRGLFSCM